MNRSRIRENSSVYGEKYPILNVSNKGTETERNINPNSIALTCSFLVIYFINLIINTNIQLNL